MRVAVRITICTLTVAGAFACSGEGARVPRAAGPLAASLDTNAGLQSTAIVVTGLSSAELAAARDVTGDSAWQQFVRVTVSRGSDTPVLGRYTVNDSAIQFAPQFALDAGRLYSVRVNRHAVSRAHSGSATSDSVAPDSVTTFSVSLPASTLLPHTSVVRILPGSDVLPENLLRFYIEFSAPMSRTGGLEFMKLLDDKGREVTQAFLPLEADFWNSERTRYTAFLDPGRVKRGILPNEQLGRAILSGRSYTLVVDSLWRDADDLPLVATYRRTFRVSEPDESRINYKRWTLRSPKAGTRDTLVVSFEKPLDHGLLKRALGVQLANGASVPGITDIQRSEREWRFVPTNPWVAGNHSLVIFSILEDAAGNRIDGAFEVDMFNEIDKSGTPERYLVTFTVFSH